MIKNVLLLLVLCITISSCSKMSLGFEKRKYRSGYYVNNSLFHKNKIIHATASYSKTESLDFSRLELPVKGIERKTNGILQPEITTPSISLIPRKIIPISSSESSAFIQENSTTESLPSKENLPTEMPHGEININSIAAFIFTLLSIAACLIGTSPALEVVLVVGVLLSVVAAILGITAISQIIRKPESKGVGFAIIGAFFGLFVIFLFIFYLYSSAV